ncbi:MAG TPA: hypothetical protein VMV27_18015 [Candidatus Binataceae bacterium]|nr:hypothetical protein [Candidatus Binataceae bacterium]
MPAAKKTPPAARKLPRFFHRMPPLAQRAYLRSDAIGKFDFDATAQARHAVRALVAALESGDSKATAGGARSVAIEVCRIAAVMPLGVEVRSVRPKNQRGELHGLFYPFNARSRTPAHIILWMRTAERHDVVKPRTFVRTLMHELVHYLDYALLRLGDSFHTMGFFRRESFLVQMLLEPDDADPDAADLGDSDGDPPS